MKGTSTRSQDEAKLRSQPTHYDHDATGENNRIQVKTAGDKKAGFHNNCHWSLGQTRNNTRKNGIYFYNKRGIYFL